MRLTPASLLILTTLSAAGAAAAHTRAPAPPPAPAADPCQAPLDRKSPDPLLAFGCANQANLRTMVANPADLDRGAAPTAPAGDAAFAAARRHRLGETKRLTDPDASASAGANGQPNSASR